MIVKIDFIMIYALLVYLQRIKMNKDYQNELFCPFLRKECIGKKCAMAISIDHYLISPYDIVWRCGLISTDSSYNHGKAKIISYEPNQTYS